MNRKAILLVFVALMAALPLQAQDFSVCHSLRGDDYEEIVEACTELLESDPQNIDAYFSRAYAHVELGNYEEAIIDYTKLLLMRPKEAFAYNNRGIAYLQLEEFEAAISDFNRAILLRPNNPSGYLSRGYAYWQMDEDERAAPDYMVWVAMNSPRIVSLDPDDALEPFTITLEEGIRFELPIEAAAGDLLTVSAIAEEVAVDPVLILLDESGNPITVDDDTAGGIDDADAIIEDFEIPEDGDYTLVIGYAGGGSDGDVRLDVHLNRVR